MIALKSAISKYGSEFTSLVIGIAVGSEDLYYDSTSDGGIIGSGPDALVNSIAQVRDAVKGTGLKDTPIGHVDTAGSWTNSSNSAVIDASDFIGVIIYPFSQTSDDNSIENAKSLFQTAFDKTSNVAGKKEVWVTETGWPVSGDTSNDAIASTRNAKTYWDEVGCDLFKGNTNAWWYTLQGSTRLTQTDWGIVKTTGSDTPVFDLSCDNVQSSSSKSSTSSSTKTSNPSSSKTESSLETGASSSSTPASADEPENNSPSPTSASQSKHKSLSGGAIAGIVIGVVIFFLTLALLFFLYRRRHRSTSLNPSHGSELPTNSNVHELDQKDTMIPYKELPTQDNKHELSNVIPATSIILPPASNKPQNQQQTNKMTSHELPVDALSATYSPTADFKTLHGLGAEQSELAGSLRASEPSNSSIQPASGRPAHTSNPAGIHGLETISSAPEPGLEVARSTTSTPIPRRPLSPALSISGLEAASSESSTNLGGGTSRIDALRVQMERVRAEKERLARERELDERESRLQEEISEELRALGGR